MQKKGKEAKEDAKEGSAEKPQFKDDKQKHGVQKKGKAKSEPTEGSQDKPHAKDDKH